MEHIKGQVNTIHEPFSSFAIIIINIAKGLLSYDLKSYRGLQHSVDDNVLQDVMSFLEARVQHDPAHAVPMKSPADMSIKELKAALREAGLLSQAAGFVEKSEFVRLLDEHYQKIGLK